MSREIVEALRAVAREKEIPEERLITALEDGLLSAYKKQDDAAPHARVEMDSASGEYKVKELLVPDQLEAQLIVETIDENTYVDPETGELVEPTEVEIPKEKFEAHAAEIEERDVTPKDFGWIAATTAKQIFMQRIREFEREKMFEEFHDRVGELVTGIVQQTDSRYTILQLRDRVEALLPRGEQVHGERYDHNQRLKAVIKDVSLTTKGPSIIVSRRDPELIRALFELEVPEMADGLVEITQVAREPGYRSKIAVVSHANGVDPVGACVGPRGSRVRMVVSELKGEKIDIIPFDDEPGRFLAKALSPAQVREVFIDDEQRQATVVVPDEDLTKAIGREGQNVRLAARLTGWRIDIKKQSAMAAATAAGEDEEDDPAGDGRCSAVLRGGRRCPNAALPGSAFCGLGAHQALVRFGIADSGVLEGITDADLAELADPDRSQEDVQAIVDAAYAEYEAREGVDVEDAPEVELDAGERPLEATDESEADIEAVEAIDDVAGAEAEVLSEADPEAAITTDTADDEAPEAAAPAGEGEPTS